MNDKGPLAALGIDRRQRLDFPRRHDALAGGQGAHERPRLARKQRNADGVDQAKPQCCEPDLTDVGEGQPVGRLPNTASAAPRPAAGGLRSLAAPVPASLPTPGARRRLRPPPPAEGRYNAAA